MIDLELAKKIGATHYSSSGSLYKKGLCNFSEFNGHSWDILSDGVAWRIEVEKIAFNEPTVETLQSALDKSQLKVMELTEQLAESARAIKITDEQRDNFDKGMREAMKKIALSCGKKFAVDIGYEDLPKLVDSLINPPRPNRTNVEYVKCDITAKEFFSDLLDGVIYYSETGEFEYKFDGNYFTDGILKLTMLPCTGVYSRTEVEILVKDAIREFIKNSTCIDENSNVESFLSESTFIDGDAWDIEWIKMCHIVAELTDKPDGGTQENPNYKPVKMGDIVGWSIKKPQ